MKSNEGLHYLFLPQAGGRVGKERKHPLVRGCVVFVDPFGSYRFVKYLGDAPVAALQVMSQDKKHGHVTNAYTDPSHRRQGHASDLLAQARGLFDTLSFSDDRSEDGEGFVTARQG